MAPTTGNTEKSSTCATLLVVLLLLSYAYIAALPSTTRTGWAPHTHLPDQTTNVDGPIIITDVIFIGLAVIIVIAVALFLYVRFVRRRPLRGPTWELRLLDGGDSDEEEEPPPLPPGVKVQVISAATVAIEGTPSLEHDSSDRQAAIRPA